MRNSHYILEHKEFNISIIEDSSLMSTCIEVLYIDTPWTSSVLYGISQKCESNVAGAWSYRISKCEHTYGHSTQPRETQRIGAVVV